MEVTDAAAVALARAGDCDAFRLLVERHSRKLFRLAFRLTGNESDAEDVVQETFLRAYRSLNQFDERAVFTSWLYRIATNHALDLLRLRKTRPAVSLSGGGESEDSLSDRLVAASPGPDRVALSGELQHRITEAMDGLTPHERTAFALRHFEGHTIEEIGSALKLGANATKQVVFRAVQKMRRALEPVGGGAAWRS
jgi:RNA polymerase sigma-70 factor (ECF subfamily)